MNRYLAMFVLMIILGMGGGVAMVSLIWWTSLEAAV